MHHGGDIYRNSIQLDFSVNLNPLPVPQTLRDAMRSGCEAGSVYPDPEQERLRAVLAEGMGVDPACVIAGNGASELILAAVRAVHPERTLLIEPGFTGYRHALHSLRSGAVTEYRMTAEEGFTLTERVLDALTPELDLVILCDPGNPTGRNIDPLLLRRILDRTETHRTMVLLDHSFYLLSAAGQSCGTDPGQLIGSYAHLIMIQSWTKVLGLPGIRMGCALSRPETIAGLRDQLPEWNVSAVAEHVMIAGAALLWGSTFCAEARKVAAEESAYMLEQLEALGCRPYPTDTVYILFQAPRELYGPLLERGILIRDCREIPGLGPGYYRIAVRDRAANRVLIRHLQEVMYEH